MDSINPNTQAYGPEQAKENPEALNPNPQGPKDNHGITIAAMAIFVLLALGAVAFLYYQNQQLKNLVASYQQVQVSPSPTATPDITANWKTFTDTNNKYSFKYPTDAKAETFTFGLVKVTFIGPVQSASGRTEAGLSDGYIVAVSNAGSASNTTLDAVAQKIYKETNTECPDTPNVSKSQLTQTKFAGLNAETFYGSCLGDYTNFFVSDGKNIYQISESIAGTQSAKQNYKTIADQILSTFQFLTPAASPINAPSAGLSCSYNGKTYKNGEGFPATDGCNSCSCTNGQVACTLIACPASQ